MTYQVNTFTQALTFYHWEYSKHGQFSVRSDVFSFGVLVLEMVTGQKNRSFQNGEDMKNLLSFVSLLFLAIINQEHNCLIYLLGKIPSQKLVFILPDES